MRIRSRNRRREDEGPFGRTAKGWGRSSRAAAAWLLLIAGAAASCAIDKTAGPKAQSAPGGSEAEFILHRPRGYEPGRAYPLLVALHGNGGSAAGLARALEALAGRPVLVAVPQGAHAKPGGGFSWFLETADRSLWPAADEAALDRVIRCIRAVAARESVDRVVVFGFSQGATMAYLAGLRHPGLVDGIAAVAGGLPGIGGEGSILRLEQIVRARRVALFLARGTTDPLIGREAFLRQKAFFEERGFRVEAMEHEGGHQLTGPLLARIWEWMARKVPSPRPRPRAASG